RRLPSRYGEMRWPLLLAVSIWARTLAPQSAPRISPHEHTSAVVHGARITVTYGRPSMRGRKIFGALVPYGRVWCPGADEATTLAVASGEGSGVLTMSWETTAVSASFTIGR